VHHIVTSSHPIETVADLRDSRVMQLHAELVKTQLRAIAEQTTELADAPIKTSMGMTTPKN